ncbi:hypothetical protein ILUMI_10696 [Ignelater luminosus]|uniref:C2H2-type domain-containing protein n=1 Tax=Ignelater luminosus TaxID=2038154 RepID=A0A8K0CXD5_IGNLU|nr:hypothetical protein ILUMI_10696 [Ignelater luminosus]
MVCHRCCEIAVKLHKYRTNAIANDKILKEQCGQPYTPPIINQDEILRVAAEIANEEMLAFKQTDGASENSSLESASSQLLNHPCQSTNVVTSQNRKKVRKGVHGHPSVRKLYKQYNNIILPVEVFKSDISPVISLDSAEITDWYAQEAHNIQKKLANIVIKKVLCNSTSTISLSPDKNIKFSYEMQSSTNDTHSNSSEGNMDKDISLSSNEYKSDTSTINATLTQTVLQSSVIATKNVHQRAKKRTTGKLQPSQNKFIHGDDQNEVIPKKKSRSFSNKVSTNSVSSKLDLPEQLPSDRRERKTIFTSSLELVPAAASAKSSASTTLVTPSLNSNLDSVAPFFDQVDCQNVMSAEKTLSVFICSICNHLCDTKKQLQDHERVHLTCRFCKIRVRNLKLLQTHQNGTCFINIVKNPPILQLDKVDSIKSMVERYPEAFKELVAQPEILHESLDSTNVDIPEDSTISEGTRLTNINTNDVEQFASPSNQFVECPAIVSVDKEPVIINSDSSKIVDSNIQVQSSNIEIVCLTDDSDDEIECTEIPTHPIVDTNKTISPLSKSYIRIAAISPNQGNIGSKGSPANTLPLTLDAFNKSQSYLNEREMIRSLFKKYGDSSMKRDTGLQTNTIPSNHIKSTDKNLILLENLLLELNKHKIPVQFESKPRVSAKFLEQPLVSKKEVLEAWENKKVIDVQKNEFSTSLKPTRSTIPIVKRPKLGLNGDKISIPKQKNTCSLVLNSQQTRRTYSKNTTVTKPATSANSTSSVGQLSLVTLPTTAGTIIAQTNNTPNLSTVPLIINSASSQSQQSGYMRIVETPNVLSYPTLYIPQPGALIQNAQQNDKVIHVNNNVTNVNKFLVLAPSVAPQLSGINLDYLNCPSVTLNQALQGQQSQTTQQLTVLTPTTETSTNTMQPLQAQTSSVRVKSLWELTQ